jgi:hypothetical protein
MLVNWYGDYYRNRHPQVQHRWVYSFRPTNGKGPPGRSPASPCVRMSVFQGAHHCTSVSPRQLPEPVKLLIYLGLNFIISPLTTYSNSVATGLGLFSCGERSRETDSTRAHGGSRAPITWLPGVCEPGSLPPGHWPALVNGIESQFPPKTNPCWPHAARALLTHPVFCDILESAFRKRFLKALLQIK